MVQEYNHHKNKTFLDWNPSDPKLFLSGSNDCRILVNSTDQNNYIMELGGNKFTYD
jgi:hypothetical protein